MKKILRLTIVFFLLGPAGCGSGNGTEEDADAADDAADDDGAQLDQDADFQEGESPEDVERDGDPADGVDTGPDPDLPAEPDGPPPPRDGIWISVDEVLALPDSGEAWDSVLDEADQAAASPNLSDQEDPTNVRIMAKALVYVRRGGDAYLDDVLAALRVVTYDNTEDGGRTLALGRELAAYVIAADLVDLGSVDAALDADFRAKLRELLTKTLDGRTLVSTHEDRPNNWGTHAAASRAAVAVYLGDAAELERTALVFRGWLGDTSAYNEFTYDSLTWQCDPAEPVGINPMGCERDGHSIDGVLPDDQRRCGDYSWPPCKTNYAWEGLQGAVAAAVILHRRGYDVWNWEDQALRRAVQWLHDTTFDDGSAYPAEGDDTWQPWLVNYYTCSDFPAPLPSSPGKNVGWTDWTHAVNPDCG